MCGTNIPTKKTSVPSETRSLGKSSWLPIGHDLLTSTGCSVGAALDHASAIEQPLILTGGQSDPKLALIKSRVVDRLRGEEFAVALDVVRMNIAKPGLNALQSLGVRDFVTHRHDQFDIYSLQPERSS
jgi:hypothetical protein